MKKKYIAGAVGVALVGFAGFNQFSYAKNLKQVLDDLVYTINTSDFPEQEVSAELSTHQSGTFSSTGIMTLTAGPSRDPMTFELAYKIVHGPTTFLTGSDYHVEITNTQIGGQGDKTITSTLLNGKPVMLSGHMAPEKLTGELTVPIIALKEGDIELDSTPITAAFTLTDFGNGGSAVYDISAHIPSLHFNSPDETLELTDGTLLIDSEYDIDTGKIKAALNIAGASVINKRAQRDNEYIGIKGLSLTTSTDIDEQLIHNVSLTFDQLEDNIQLLSDAEFSYTLAGIDGKAILDIVDISQYAAQEDWSEHRLQQAIEEIIMDRGDQLLAHNPSLEINRIKATLNDELLIDGKGLVKLYAARLPENFVRSVLDNPYSLNPQNVEKAIFADVEARLGQSAGAAIAMLDPSAAALLAESGETFSFKMKDGNVTLNGKQL